ncbi:MAG TPA: DUF4395 domain-containing protein [Acidimicrobiales bacterium]|jgi:hypothetical protein|nr:DUF4395 domain-containing protein [Acidimicrobiales bacterium]
MGDFPSAGPVPAARTPRPIDPRGPRFNQAVISALLLVAFVGNWPVVVPAVAVVLLAGALLGPRFGPFLALYASVIKPRLGPPAELEDPRPPRFAAGFGALVLGAATVAFVAGHVDIGWFLALAVAVLAGLAAGTGICIGCEIYLVTARLRGVSVPRSVEPDPSRPPAR